MAKFFKFIGYTSLAFFIITIFLQFIRVIKNEQVWTYILQIIFEPALSLLFISYGNHLDTNRRIETPKSTSNNYLVEVSNKNETHSAYVSFGSDNIKIGSERYNLKATKIFNIDKQGAIVRFEIKSNDYKIKFPNDKIATEFYNFLQSYQYLFDNTF